MSWCYPDEFRRCNTRGGCESTFGSRNRRHAATANGSTGGSGRGGLFLELKEGFIYDGGLCDGIPSILENADMQVDGGVTAA